MRIPFGGRWSQRNDFHPGLRLASLVLPGNPINAYTVPVARRLTVLIPPSRSVRKVDLGDGLRLRVFAPAADEPSAASPGPALIWIHGGGHVIGTAAQEDRWSRRMADAAGITVISVDYRLSPQHPYPAAVDDCYRALEWAADQPELDSGRLIVGGASAGGCLAAALAHRACDIGAITPILQLLTYPMLDDRSSNAHPHHRVWGARSNEYSWRSYIGAADPVDAVPARREDLSGLSPAWIGVGTHDLFLDEDRDYARRLRDAGVPCDVEEFAGAFHGFDALLPRARVSKEFFAAQVRAVEKSLELSDHG